MLETIKFFLTQFNEEALAVCFLLLAIAVVLLVVVWSYNRKRFHELAHHIPASVLKSYLDTIIQNSSALKSSLLRGGGPDIFVAPSAPPQYVVPSTDANAAQNLELLNMKNAELAHVQGKLNEKEKIIHDLENQIQKLMEKQGSTEGNSSASQEEIDQLKSQLNEARNAEERIKDSLGPITQERDELKSKLQEYEIIEDDLANLKKLQTENEELRQEIERLKGGSNSAPEASAAAAVATLAAENPLTEALESIEPEPTPDSFITDVQGEDTGEADMLAAMNEGKLEDLMKPEPVAAEEKKEDKSAEDLLSEFEKMLE